MNQGLFEAQLNEIHRLLKIINLLEERNYPHFPANPRAIFKSLSYPQIWELIYKEQYYNFRLVDDSLLQFKLETENVLCFHYSYYDCPYEPKMSIEEFEQKHPLNEKYQIEELQLDYENYIVPKAKETFIPIRYDYDPQLYNPCIHPASHIHIGHNNSIRVSAKKILRPLSFILLIIRQIYPEYWGGITRLRNSEELLRNIRESLDEVSPSQWTVQDEKQQYLA